MADTERSNLILQRAPGQSIRIGDDIEVCILSVRGQQVRVAFRAPRDVNIVRTELLARGRKT